MPQHVAPGPIRTMTKRVLNSTYEVVETTYGTESENCSMASQSGPASELRENMNYELERILMKAEHKIEEIAQKKITCLDDVNEQLRQMECYDEEMSVIVPQYMSYLKKTELSRRKIVEIDRKRSKL